VISGSESLAQSDHEVRLPIQRPEFGKGADLLLLFQNDEGEFLRLAVIQGANELISLCLVFEQAFCRFENVGILLLDLCDALFGRLSGD